MSHASGSAATPRLPRNARGKLCDLLRTLSSTVGSFGGHHELPAAAPLPVIRLRKQGGGASESLGLPVDRSSIQYQALVAVSRVACDACLHSCLTLFGVLLIFGVRSMN